MSGDGPSYGEYEEAYGAQEEGDDPRPLPTTTPMPKRPKKPRCYFGCEKRATFPKDAPRWCSMRCAAEWAVESKSCVDDEKWCLRHEAWEYPSSGNDCVFTDDTEMDC